MKRHPALQSLSQDHHQALVLARALRSDTPSALRGGMPEAPDAMLAATLARFEDALWPHFLLEERELWPLGLCSDGPLRAAVQTMRDQHRDIRRRVAALGPEGFDGLGVALTEHVRFEERTLFPTLEAALDEAALETLAARLQPTPEVAITAFEPDGEGVWVARLACGHGRHVRHQPPMHVAPWVLDAEARKARVGERLPCQLCRMPQLPRCATVYRATDELDAESVPKGLLKSHRLKPGAWGRIVVLAGYVDYVLEDERDLTLTLRPGVDGIVAPERPHHIRPRQDARLRVEFMHVV